VALRHRAETKEPAARPALLFWSCAVAGGRTQCRARKPVGAPPAVERGQRDRDERLADRGGPV